MSASGLGAAVVIRTGAACRAARDRARRADRSPMTSSYASRVVTPNEPSRPARRPPMSNRTYRITEIVGTSPDGIDQAVRNGVQRAGQTLRHVDWFEVIN